MSTYFEVNFGKGCRKSYRNCNRSQKLTFEVRISNCNIYMKIEQQYEWSLATIVGLPQRLPRWSFCDAKGMSRINSNYE